MDAQHFDAFVRCLALGPSRRGLVTGLAGGVFTALTGASLAEGAAKKAKKGKKGKKGKKKKRSDGLRCTGTLEKCSDECVDLTSDADNCGTCDRRCGPNEICDGGACRCGNAVCLTGFTCCSGECVDTESDTNNCGNCGTRCTVNESCEAGVCMCGQIQCGDGFTCCEAGGCFCAPGPDGGFGTAFGSPVGTCEVEEVNDACPAGLTTCSGPEGFCRACCPANTTCDASRGVCLPAI